MLRFIDNELLEWKNHPRRKPLIIRGARQVGKTYSILQFAQNHFENFIHLDFEQTPDACAIFQNSLIPEQLLFRIEAYTQQRITPGNTLLFLDEIQRCPKAMLSLRYFYEQIPELHIIAAGSLLELALESFSFPVGRVQFKWMYPMNFAEFLIATGHAFLAEQLPNLSTEEPLDEIVHNKLMELLPIYFLVGGMPEAVKTYVETHSFQAVTEVLRELKIGYYQDFVKYRSKIDVDVIQQIFEQLACKTGQQIKYIQLYPEKRIEKIKEALHFLEMAYIFHKVQATSAQGLPLGASAKPRIFKTIFMDIGLMQHICGITPQAILQSANLLSIYQGALAEQFVGQELLTIGGSEDNKLFYWVRDKKGSQAEVDFLIARNGTIYPVEVKSGKSGRMRSLHVFLSEHPNSPMGIVLNQGNIHFDARYRLKFMPLYTRLTFE